MPSSCELPTPASPDRARLLTLQLFRAARSGDYKACRRFVAQGADVLALRHGGTALHEACSHNCGRVVRVLLQCGADSSVKDDRGQTPEQVAKKSGAKRALHELRVADSSPPAFTASAWLKCSLEDDDYEGLGRPPSKRRLDHFSGDWDERLRQYLSDDEDQAGFGDGLWKEDQPDSFEDIAQRVWAALRARAREAARAAEAAADAGCFRGPKVATVAPPESAMDWQKAQEQGDVVALRAAYEARWLVAQQATKDATAAMRLEDVPWIAGRVPDSSLASLIRDIVLADSRSLEEGKKRVRAQLVRWHPDKFEARFGRCFATPEEKSAALELVHLQSLILLDLAASLKNE